MIVEEYEDWRKVIDFRHNSGWIHKSLIKGNRFGIIVINSNSFVKVFNTINGKEIGEIEDGNIIELRKCKQDWCLVGIQNKYGWIKKFTSGELMSMKFLILDFYSILKIFT